MYITVPKAILNTPKKFLLFIKAYYLTPSLCPICYKQLGSHIYLGQWRLYCTLSGSFKLTLSLSHQSKLAYFV